MKEVSDPNVSIPLMTPDTIIAVFLELARAAYQIETIKDLVHL
jgi:hypothetical protein